MRRRRWLEADPAGGLQRRKGSSTVPAASTRPPCSDCSACPASGYGSAPCGGCSTRPPPALLARLHGEGAARLAGRSHPNAPLITLWGAPSAPEASRPGTSGRRGSLRTACRRSRRCSRSSKHLHRPVVAKDDDRRHPGRNEDDNARPGPGFENRVSQLPPEVGRVLEAATQCGDEETESRPDSLRWGQPAACLPGEVTFATRHAGSNVRGRGAEQPGR